MKLLFEKSVIIFEIYSGCPPNPHTSDTRKRFPVRPSTHQSYQRAKLVNTIKTQHNMFNYVSSMTSEMNTSESHRSLCGSEYCYWKFYQKKFFFLIPCISDQIFIIYLIFFPFHFYLSQLLLSLKDKVIAFNSKQNCGKPSLHDKK